MARIWMERADPTRHADFMSTHSIGGVPIHTPRDPLLRPYVLLVTVCGFTFQFHSQAQVNDAIAFFARAIHPSSRQPNVVLEHYWHPWSQRLPKGLTAHSKRVRILSALHKAIRSPGVHRLPVT